MALKWYTFEVRKAGVPTGGLAPVFTKFAVLGVPPLTAFTPRPTIYDLDGSGSYAFQYDVEAHGPALVTIDAVDGTLTDAERLITMILSCDLVEPGIPAMTALARMGAALCGQNSVTTDGLTWTYYAMGNTDNSVPRIVAQTTQSGLRTVVTFA